MGLFLQTKSVINWNINNSFVRLSPTTQKIKKMFSRSSWSQKADNSTPKYLDWNNGEIRQEQASLKRPPSIDESKS